MHTFTLSELAKKLRAKEFSVTELTKSLLARIESSQTSLNAFITVLAEHALDEAREAEREILAGRYRGPLRRAVVRSRRKSPPSDA